MNTIDYSTLIVLLAPETIVVMAALVTLAADLTALRRKPMLLRMSVGAGVTIFGSVVAIGWLCFTNIPGKHDFEEGMLIFGPLTVFLQCLTLVLTAFTALLSVESDFTDHVGEYFALLLMATTGMLFLVSSENLLLIFLSLELLSLSLYILAGFNKRDSKSAEAALKYFLFGAMSAAFMLFGISLIYGLTGEITFSKIAPALKGITLDPLLLVGILMLIAGFGFKVAAVPFHLWAPGVYQGAPITSAAFIASGSKVASFFVLAQAMELGLAGAEGSSSWGNFTRGWVPMLSMVAVLSMLLGNIAAIAQTSVRRLLAYSAIAQAGYVLLAILAEGGKAPGHQGLAALIYYVSTYGLTIIGAFAVVAVVERSTGDEKLHCFAGLAMKSPLLSVCMLVFMLSLAGIPPLAGFFGKFYVFVSVLNTPAQFGMLWVVILAIALSAVSLYYYLQVLKQIFVAEPSTESGAFKAGIPTHFTIVTLAAAVILLGCAPTLVLDYLLTFLKAY